MAREYRLSHSHTYSIIDYSYVSIMDGGGHPCENCGQLITSMVTIGCSDGKQYIIGTDCAKTLTSLDKRDLQLANTSIKALKRFYKKLNDLKKYGHEVIVKEDGDFYSTWTIIRTDYMGNQVKPRERYEMSSIPKNKAYMPIIEKYLQKTTPQ